MLRAINLQLRLFPGLQLFSALRKAKILPFEATSFLIIVKTENPSCGTHTVLVCTPFIVVVGELARGCSSPIGVEVVAVGW